MAEIEMLEQLACQHGGCSVNEFTAAVADYEDARPSTRILHFPATEPGRANVWVGVTRKPLGETSELPHPQPVYDSAVEYLKVNPCTYVKTGECALNVFAVKAVLGRIKVK